MKKVYPVYFVLICFCIPLSGQQETKTLFGKNKPEPAWGSFFGPDIKITQFNGQLTPYAGLRWAYLVNHKLAFGISGGGILGNKAFRGTGTQGMPADFHPLCAYGGLYLDHYIHLNAPVMISFPTTIGAGGILIFEDELDPLLGKVEKKFVEGTPCFIFEPSVSAEILLLSYLRMGIGAGYRLAMGVDLTQLGNKDISGVAITFSLKAGMF